MTFTTPVLLMLLEDDDESVITSYSIHYTKLYDYVDTFLSKMEFGSEDTVLDIGCGPGTLALALALAKRVKKVIAIDYAEGMLEQLHLHAAEQGISNIETYHMGWDDDWRNNFV